MHTDRGRGESTTEGDDVRTLAEAIALHLADCKYRHLSLKTISLYETYETMYLAYLEEHDLAPGLSSLNAANVKNATQWVRQRSRGSRKGESAARVFVAIMKILSRFLMDEDIIPFDYLARVKRPKVTTTARRPFMPWEIQAIRGAMQESRTSRRDVAILSLLLDTGLRIGELCALTLADVDLRVYRVHVRSGKGRLERVVPFGDTSRNGGRTAARLREYLNERRPVRATEQFFLTYDGFPLASRGYYQAFQRACRRASVRHTTVHATRHTFATRFLVAHPGDVAQLRYLLGHLSDDAFETYTGHAGELLAQVSDRFSISDEMEAAQSH